MVLKAERQRIKALLTEAITVLCKNGLGYKYTCAIEGLLGITLDDEDVFLVNINETIKGAERPPPEEETAKQDQEGAPESPATTASPSGTPRRRRRRSNNDQGDGSPAKRAAYGEDEKPGQNPDDVIVIKEEVSESDFSNQFYGDTGGGPEDNGQYQLQPDQYGAGCSQWDTSETQGGQPGWPAFSSHQQQQISQAASSAMMSPTQDITGRESTQAASKLQSVPVRNILSKQIVASVLDSGWSVSAFRMHWNKETDDTIENVWNRISEVRASLDYLVQQLEGIVYFVSAINATNSSLINGQRKVRPGVFYWVVLERPLDCRVITQQMDNNSVRASVKLQLQPFQTREKDLCSSLFNAVKDNMGGCVRRMVEESQSNSMYQAKEPIVKVYIAKHGPKQLLSTALSDLSSVRFSAELYEM